MCYVTCVLCRVDAVQFKDQTHNFLTVEIRCPIKSVFEADDFLLREEFLTESMFLFAGSCSVFQDPSTRQRSWGYVHLLCLLHLLTLDRSFHLHSEFRAFFVLYPFICNHSKDGTPPPWVFFLFTISAAWAAPKGQWEIAQFVIYPM